MPAGPLLPRNSFSLTAHSRRVWQATALRRYLSFQIPPADLRSVKSIRALCHDQDASRLPEGYEYRLPTEAEWEYASRGGNRGRNTKYAGSNTIGDVGWYLGSRPRKPHPVGQKQANELGLYDMSGNVWEWCHDNFESYSSGSQKDPVGPDTGSYGRVNRGGGWQTVGVSCSVTCRLWPRKYRAPTYANSTIGFRVVLASPVRR
ncbi:MAG: SUMF1/EgtB/PvdO family nonheme iron enzyme [Phycisphaeraceae bacterium]|nr:SUMF1/EgtB/PvdO family nonheme iron enzyme [Phycisphaeraceae bacterium]